MEATTTDGRPGDRITTDGAVVGRVAERSARATLLRAALGASLRRLRVTQGRTLRNVSATAQVSLGYLSEVERGQKEASSELLAAICTALDVEVADVVAEASRRMRAPISKVVIPAPTALAAA